MERQTNNYTLSNHEVATDHLANLDNDDFIVLRVNGREGAYSRCELPVENGENALDVGAL